MFLRLCTRAPNISMLPSSSVGTADGEVEEGVGEECVGFILKSVCYVYEREECDEVPSVCLDWRMMAKLCVQCCEISRHLLTAS